MVIDFDVDGDGKITAEEIAMKERMLEVELREEKLSLRSLWHG
jgi:hypothetical protein